VSNAGDVNGDGFDDVIVGAFGADPNGELSSGSSYVVFGKASGFSATMDLSSLDGSNGFRWMGRQRVIFRFSVSNAGDVNGDGFDDVIVGAAGGSEWHTHQVPVMWCLVRHPVSVPRWIYPVSMVAMVFVWMGCSGMIIQAFRSAVRAM
jgi:hypothetical protein